MERTPGLLRMHSIARRLLRHPFMPKGMTVSYNDGVEGAPPQKPYPTANGQNLTARSLVNNHWQGYICPGKDAAMKNIAVIGSGTMGNGIAHVFAQRGFKVSGWLHLEALKGRNKVRRTDPVAKSKFCNVEFSLKDN